MADILKITTPMVNKNQIQLNRQPEPSAQFNMQEIAKVIAPGAQTELLRQNNGLIEQDEAPTLLMNMLKDPSVTVGFLKNIFTMQEIIKLLPVNNRAITQEIELLFDSLMIRPEDIIPEMIRQENSSTDFKGELFDFLRRILAENPSSQQRASVASLLKAINSVINRRDILDALANSLQFLSHGVHSSKSLSVRLADLSARFRQADAALSFQQLKQETMAALGELENSLLFSSRLSKVVSMTTYNLSRFNDNPDFLQEAATELLTQLDGAALKQELSQKLMNWLETVSNSDRAQENSRIMEVISQILGKQASEEAVTLISADKIEKIIHSLLSSPCNFTPLLHFVVPVEYNNVKSFAEIWVDPNESEGERSGENGPGVHMLLVFDIEGMGRFEAELHVRGSEIELGLFCPPDYLPAFTGAREELVKCISGSGFRFSNVNIVKLERQRSLMDVFKFLPYRRTGVDVKI